MITWVNDITGLSCYWGKRPRPNHFGDAYAVLWIGSRRSVGNDDLITEYDDTAAAGSEIRTYQAGQRQFTFQIQVRTSRQSDDTDAMHYTSLLRDSVCLPEKSEAVFEEAGIAFARVLSETDVGELLDNRDLSVAQLDLLFNATAITEDTATGYIELLEDFDFYDVDSPAPPLWTGDIEVG